MIVPKYWSEAQEKLKIDTRRYTIKRFGWSNESEEAATLHAQQRVNDAVGELKAGKDIRRVDHKVAYNGAEGIPIREEIIEEHGDNVITRNSYGALCLNTPNVFFADIDLPEDASRAAFIISAVLLVTTSIVAGILFSNWLTLLALALLFPVASLVQKIIYAIQGGKFAGALKKIRKFSGSHPELNLRIYQTPNGYRVMAINKLFEPRDEATIALMEELDSDKIYITMCRNQNCFRARVSAKPWRIGMKRIKPNHGVWPIRRERMSERRIWVSDYESNSRNYAACHFIEQLGSKATDIKAKRVMELHDKLCNANQSTLPLA